MTPHFSVCVYCGSRPGLKPEFAHAAQQVGTWIGRHGGQLVYGGGKSGLMGLLADAALESGAHVVGVIPNALVEKEWAHRECTELHIVDTMHDRKRMMAERADVFLTLPGGIGTFEEFFEVWTWRQLGYHDKPIGILNVAGYYYRLFEFLAESGNAELMNDWQMSLVRQGDDPHSLLAELVQAAGMAGRADLTKI